MAFPPAGSYLCSTPASADAARTAWSAVAHAIAEFEPVTMLVDAGDLPRARDYLHSDVDLVSAALDDAWMRDIGPTFVLDDAGRLGAIEWVFNGWGQQTWATWDRDREVNTAVTALAGAESIPSSLVNEGGAIHVDGLGTVLVTETVQLDPFRNPGLDKADVEAELLRTVGASHAIWLPRGLTRDSEQFGTRGHVDIVATIPSPGRLLVHRQDDAAHPDYRVTRELIELLHDTRDATGKAWQITEVPAPVTVRDGEGWVDYSYINHVVVNGGVIGCAFDDPNDAQAQALLADAYPGREIVMIDARVIFGGGGGIHCITQQQPASPSTDS
jgi:agmatine deiminase